MKTTVATKDVWPRKVTFGRETVTVYRRKMPNGQTGFLVSNYSQRDDSGKAVRRLDAYVDEAVALEAAQKLAKQMSRLDVVAAGLTNKQAIEFAAATETLAPSGVTLTMAASTIAEGVRLLGDVSSIIAAAKFFKSRHKVVASKRFKDVVDELIEVKIARGASKRYVEDLRSRGNRLAAVFAMDIGSVTTSQLQQWFDAQKFSPGNYSGFRRIAHLIFEFGKARNHALDNPAVGLEKVKAKQSQTEIYTAREIEQLLVASRAC